MSKLWFETALLPQGWAKGVRITTGAEGLIESIEEGTVFGEEDERHAIGLPGIPNVHSHAFQRGLAGLTERRGPTEAQGRESQEAPAATGAARRESREASGARNGARLGTTEDSFWTWRELMYRFVERVDPEGVEAIAALVYAEMLEGGFTHVGEFHYLHHDRGGVPFSNPGELATRIAAASEQTGIGLTLLPTFYAHSGFGGAEPTARQHRFINDVDSFARIVEASRTAVRHLRGATVGIAPHSLRAVTPEELTAIVPLAQGEAIHIHIAEQTKEVDDCIAWSGRRPIEWLLGAHPVDERWCLVHATHATDAEVRAMAASGTIVGLCPITEANLGDGVFPAPAFLRLKGRFGIGSDSNILLDGAEELRILEYSQRLALRARNVLATAEGRSTGRSLLEGALSGGARALHSVRGSGARGPRTGALRAGASADIVSLNAQHAALAERNEDEILDSWIFAAGRAVVDCVWRGGVKVVINGRHHRRDALLRRYRHTLKELLA